MTGGQGPPDGKMHRQLPGPARVIARWIPAGDRDAVVGDLLEDAYDRGVPDARRTWWLSRECAAIALGLSAHCARSWFVLPPVRELAAGLVIDGRGALRGDAIGRLVYALLFCGSVVTLALGVELLVGSLLVAAGL